MNSFYSEEEIKKIGFKKIGKNVLISRNACIYGASNISIGDNVRIDDFCILSGNIIIGNYIHISAATLLFGGKNGIVLEDFVSVSSRCAIYAETDDYSGNAMANPMIPEEYRNVQGGKVLLKKHVLIGTGCTILPSVIIEEGVSVGAMSLINKSLNKWNIYIGIPCKKLKERKKDILELEDRLNGNK